MLYAGDLRHEVILQRLVTTDDGGGGVSQTWVDYLSTRAHIAPATAKEVTVNGRVEERLFARIIMRWAPGIDALMRLLYGTRVFNIRGVRNLDERNRWIELFAEEGVPQ